MSQQINLLIQKRERASTALAALIGVSVVLVGLLGYWGLEHSETVKIQHAAAKIEQQMLAAKTNLQAFQQKLDSGEKATDIEAEIAVLKTQLEASQEVVTLLQKGELGNADGYAGYLTTLAKISENDLWLTSVSISNAGKNISIAGRALQSESVLRYAQRLNQQFASYGVQFTSVEMTPEVFSKEGTATPPLSTVVFKLF